jgi:phage baseplate assembly protein W
MTDNSDIAFGSLTSAHPDFYPSASGDAATVAGTDNTKAALIRALLATPGCLPHRPTWGAGIARYQNMPLTIPKQQQLVQAIKAQLLRDSRVSAVRSVSIAYDDAKPDQTAITVVCVLAGEGNTSFVFKPFSLV